MQYGGAGHHAAPPQRLVSPKSSPFYNEQPRCSVPKGLASLRDFLHKFRSKYKVRVA